MQVTNKLSQDRMSDFGRGVKILDYGDYRGCGFESTIVTVTNVWEPALKQIGGLLHNSTKNSLNL